MFNFIKNFFKNLFGKKEAIIPDNPGLIESPQDFRDVPMLAVSRKTAPLPEKHRIPYILTIKNQGNKPHCVGYTCATIKEFLERREGNFIEFDGDWIYKKCKEIDGIPNVAGTYFRAGLKVLQKFGAKPLNGKEEDASKYRIGGYVRVGLDFKSLKQAIYEFGAILVGFRWSVQGWRVAYIRPPKKGEKTYGHAATGINYEVTYINGQNSFGESWGEEGLFYFTKDYRPIDAWAVVVDLPSNWKELLGEDKTKPHYFFKNDLWRGLRNEEVKILQDCLKRFGCFDPQVKSSGWFGPITQQALIVFQKRFQIEPAVGYFGPISRAKMNQLINQTEKLY